MKIILLKVPLLSLKDLKIILTSFISAIMKHIFDTWDPLVTDADGKKKPIKNLPKWLKVDELRTRIRNRVKHYTSERKSRARIMAGASDDFMELYKESRDEEHFEVISATILLQPLYMRHHY